MSTPTQTPYGSPSHNGQPSVGPRLRADGVVVHIGNKTILDRVDIAVDPGEVVGVVGPNGSGKSTLLRVLHGARTVSEGSVELDGQPLSQLRPNEVAGKIAVVAQDEQTALPLRVGEAVLLGRLPHLSGMSRWRPQDRTAAGKAMAMTRIAHLVDRSVTTLSGGERQRVLIARALAQETELVLWDEPTNHLDIKHAHEGLALLRRTGLSGVVVLHDLNLAARYCDRLVVLDRGSVAADGSPASVCQPELIAEVFGVAAAATEHDGVRQLLFSASIDISPAHRQS